MNRGVVIRVTLVIYFWWCSPRRFKRWTHESLSKCCFLCDWWFNQDSFLD